MKFIPLFLVAVCAMLLATLLSCWLVSLGFEPVVSFITFGLVTGVGCIVCLWRLWEAAKEEWLDIVTQGIGA